MSNKGYGTRQLAGAAEEGGKAGELALEALEDLAAVSSEAKECHDAVRAAPQ